MCRKNSYHPDSVIHMKRWDLKDDDFYMSTYHQVAGATDWPIIIFDSVEKRNTSVQAHWGILPDWVSAEKEALKMSNRFVNVRSEDINSTKLYAPLVKTQRCIVPSTGFYEYHWLDPKGKTKVPVHIKLKDQEIFGIPGVYSVWPQRAREGQHVIVSFSLLTTAANELMAKIHKGGDNPHRMPLIIERHMEKEWLTGNFEAVRNYHIPADRMQAVAVKKIPQQFVDDACLLDRHEWPGMEWLDGREPSKPQQQQQISLF